MKNKSFERITVTSVTGDASYIQGSIYAIQRSCAALEGAKGLLISPPLPENVILPEGITHKVISPFGYMEYNIFILYQLDYFIDTDFCLLVQNDGWVLNADNWKDEFLNYDYIGAPVPSYFILNSENSFTIESTEHYFNNLDLIHNPRYIEPQNGGFSLRSKKLLGIVRKLGLQYIVNPPKPADINQPIYKMDWSTLIHNEDLFLSALYRNNLINAGIKFAPSQVALNFAVESVSLHRARNVELADVFGCHFFGFIRLIEYNKVEVHLHGHLAYESEENIRQIPNISLLMRLGYYLNIILHR